MELHALGQMVWLAVIVVVLFLILAPVLIWHQTSKASRLLEDLLDEQEHTNELLRTLLKKGTVAADEPEFLLSVRSPEPGPGPDAPDEEDPHA